MPELPEVQTVVVTLEKLIQSRKITRTDVLYPPIVEEEIDLFKEKMNHQHFRTFSRKGKFLIFGLDTGFLVVHLRMEGKFFVVGDEFQVDKHAHVVFSLDDGRRLIYHDVRKFGRMSYVEKIENHVGIRRLGYEIWDKECDLDYFQSQTSRRTIPIKTLLLDQSVIAGIGNIYANEILFAAKVHPETPANQVSNSKLKIILIEIKRILEEAIKQGGTSIRSYTSQLGVTGLFQQSLLVHSRLNLPCVNCGRPVKKIFVSGRGTYYCSYCQRKQPRV